MTQHIIVTDEACDVHFLLSSTFTLSLRYYLVFNLLYIHPHNSDKG